MVAVIAAEGGYQELRITGLGVLMLIAAAIVVILAGLVWLLVRWQRDARPNEGRGSDNRH